jgi:hypothetical protein
MYYSPELAWAHIAHLRREARLANGHDGHASFSRLRAYAARRRDAR